VGALVAYLALAVLVIVYLPLFICMPPEIDIAMYDLVARLWLRGGVIYRDIFENNLPGMVWAHAAIRSLLGWSSEAIRLVDVLVVAGIVSLLLGLLRRAGQTKPLRAWTALALVAFYSSTTEWVHCQRDIWMLLLALGAVALRSLQVERLTAPRLEWGRLFAWSLLEGACWAAACWLKPHVAIPAFFCILVSAALFRRMAPRGYSRLALDLGGVLAGGLLVGALGYAALRSNGAWPYMIDTMVWNRHYARTSWQPFTRYKYRDALHVFIPWGRTLLWALPVAVLMVLRGVGGPPLDPLPRRILTPLLAALYLGWLTQLFLLQSRWLEYPKAPAVMLAIAVIAIGWSRSRSAESRLIEAMLIFVVIDMLIDDLGTWLFGRDLPVRWAIRSAAQAVVILPLVLWDHPGVQAVRRLAVTASLLIFAAYALANHPVSRPERTALWARCLREGSTPQIRDRLTLTDRIDWVSLAEVARYLRDAGTRDRELTCYDARTCPLYLDLGIKPSTRHVFFNNYLEHSPQDLRRAACQEVARSPQRFVVSDLLGIFDDHAARHASVTSDADLPPKYRGVFPWSEPIVFRSGRYLVHAVEGPIDRCSPDD
jgi:hypothetical protein